MLESVNDIKDDIKNENSNYHNFNKLISTSFKYLKVNAKYLNNSLLEKLVQRIWNNIVDYYIEINIMDISDIRLYRFHKHLRLSDRASFYDENHSLLLVRFSHGLFSKKVIRKANLSDVLAFISELEKRIDTYHNREMISLNKELANAKNAQDNLKHITHQHNSWTDLYKQTDKGD